MQCGSALNDDIVKFSCTKMTELREFGFSNCHEMSDVGVRVKRNGETIHHGIGTFAGKILLPVTYYHFTV